jgi:hypothetical protein
MKRISLVVLPVGLVAVLCVVGGALAAKPASPPAPDPALFPDLRTVVPQHLNLVNQGQQEYLRFSNGIANTGPGPWALRAEHDLTGTVQTTTAYQEIRTNNSAYECGTQPKQVTECYEIQSERAASVFEYHPTHNHWHTADAARFEVRVGSATGPIAGSQSVKVGFCLIEIYRLEGNSPTSERTFWDCHGTHQGIGSGWVDQYHQATDGQQVTLTGLPAETTTTGLDDRPDRRLPRDERRQQHGVGALQSVEHEQRESEGHRDRTLAVCEPGGSAGRVRRTRADVEPAASGPKQASSVTGGRRSPRTTLESAAAAGVDYCNQ